MTKHVDTSMHLSNWRGRNKILKAIHSLVHMNGLNTHSNYVQEMDMHFLHLLALEFVDTLPLGRVFIDPVILHSFLEVTGVKAGLLAANPSAL